MLRASHFTLKPGGRTVFIVIEPAPGLPSRLRRRAARDGPVAVSVRTSYPGLLSSAGFSHIEAHDLTPEFRRTQQDWIDAFASREPDLKEAFGEDAFKERQQRRSRVIQAIDDKVLRRSFYAAVR